MIVPRVARDKPVWPPLVIAVAPNGARRVRADHQALPITPAEIAESAARCLEAGACMIHMHVRDRDGGHTLDTDAYRAATAAVRDAVGDDLIIQVTSEAVGLYLPEEQMAMVHEVRPEAVSMAIRELVPDEAHEAPAADFFAWLLRENIMPQYIVYSADEVARFADLRRRGVIPGDGVFVLYVLGRYKEGQVSEPIDLLPFLEVTGSMACHWAMCAFGPREGACAMMVTALGGHARVGFENNRYMNSGALAPDNAALVAQVAEGARLVHRPVADADAARQLLATPIAGPWPHHAPTSALSELVRPAAGQGVS